MGCIRGFYEGLKGPYEPTAYFAAGESLIRDLGDGQRGVAILRQLVDRFPEAIHGKRAEAVLARMPAART